MPATFRAMQAIEPVFEKLPGWRTSTKGISIYSDLPQTARDYVQYLESRTGVEVGCVSTGPERMETMIRPGSNLEKLLA
jgi:adenylosuccinate synthase